MSKYIELGKVKEMVFNADMSMAETEALYKSLDNLPTIEVSEDCISRVTALDIAVAYVGAEMVDRMLTAPSVVPTAEQSSIVDIVTCEECKRCEKGLVIERRSDGQENIVNLCNRTKPPTMVSLDFYCKDGERIEE